MAESAALYFGQDSYGLVRRPLIREGRILLGEPKVLSVVEDETNPGAAESAATPVSLVGDWQDTTPGRLPVMVHIDQGGNATFENPSEHAMLPARVSVHGDSVTVIVPGWNISFRGTHHGDRMSGTISQYGTAGPLNLIKTPKIIDKSHHAENGARTRGDAPQESDSDPAEPPAKP